jgi:hypothetical protein
MAMQRARRLASVAVVASLAVAGLSACRSQPTVAAYVGSGTISDDRVKGILDEALASPLPVQQGEAPSPSVTRADVMSALIGSEVMAEVAKKSNVSLPADLGLDTYATQWHVKADTEFIKLYGTANDYIKLLRQGSTGSGQLNEADLKQIYDVLSASGETGGASFEQFKTSLPDQNKQLVTSSSAIRDSINEVTGPLNIRVNPRYQPAEITVLQFQTQNGAVKPLITAPFGHNQSAPVSPVS